MEPIILLEASSDLCGHPQNLVTHIPLTMALFHENVLMRTIQHILALSLHFLRLMSNCEGRGWNKSLFFLTINTCKKSFLFSNMLKTYIYLFIHHLLIVNLAVETSGGSHYPFSELRLGQMRKPFIFLFFKRSNTSMYSHVFYLRFSFLCFHGYPNNIYPFQEKKYLQMAVLLK